jgi:hypothetical protein
MGNPEEPIKRPAFAKDFEKVTEEAWSKGRMPMLAIRYYDPESILLTAQAGWT